MAEAKDSKQATAAKVAADDETKRRDSTPQRQLQLFHEEEEEDGDDDAMIQQQQQQELPMSPDDSFSQDLTDFVLSDEELLFGPDTKLGSSAPASLNLSSTSTTTAGVGVHQHHRLHMDEDSTSEVFAEDDDVDDEGKQVGGPVLPSSPSTEAKATPQRTTNTTKSSSAAAAAAASSSSSSTPIPASASLFRYIRNLGRSSYSQDDIDAAVGSPRESSSESGSDDDDSSSYDDSSYEAYGGGYGGEESLDMELKSGSWEEPVDWNRLPVLPNRFCVTVPHQKKDNDDGAESPHAQAASMTEEKAPHYLDNSLLQNAHELTVATADEFAWEHAAILRAVLQLLAERDQVGVEGSIEHTDNIRKKGPLKKLSFAVGRRKHQPPAVAGAWKVKYVELRQGNLCYYEDSAPSRSSGRKTIHLRQAECTVQESSYRGPGFVLELLVSGSPTRYWMASSEKERQAWIRAIQTSMIGDDAPRKDLDLEPYQESLDVYTALRDTLQTVDSPDAYLAAIQNVLKKVSTLQVPVDWIREKIEQDLSPLLLGTLKPPKFGRSPQKLLKTSLAEFWKSMRLTTFSINGMTVPRGSQLASERTIGAVSRCILEFDKAFLAAEEEKEEHDDVAATLFPDPRTSSAEISELQAVSYARSIFLSVLRSKERQDATCAVKYLLQGQNVVVVEDNCSAEDNEIGVVDVPVHMEISFPGEDLPDDFLPGSDEISAWVSTRLRRSKNSSLASSVSSTVSSNKWKQRYSFVVLSGSVLSYYEAADPRPHGLRGQFVLTPDTVLTQECEEAVAADSSSTGPDSFSSGTKNNNFSNNSGRVRYVLCLSSSGHQDRLLSFDSQEDATAWKDAIQSAIESIGSQHPSPPRVVTTASTNKSLTEPAKMLVKGAERAIKVAADGTIQGGIRAIKGAKDGSIRVIRGAKDSGIRVIKTATGSGFKVIRGAVGRLRPNKNMDMSGSDRRRPSMQILLNNTIVHGKQQPTVQCVVQTLQTFTVRDHSYTEHSTTDHSNSHTNTGESSSEDGWVTVQAKLYQAFLMSGGTSGRIAQGDALVELDFLGVTVANDGDFADDESSRSSDRSVEKHL